MLKAVETLAGWRELSDLEADFTVTVPEDLVDLALRKVQIRLYFAEMEAIGNR